MRLVRKHVNKKRETATAVVRPFRADGGQGANITGPYFGENGEL